MSNSEKPFQLNPADFKTGNILVDGAVKGAVNAVNKMDMNKDGISDVSQIVPVVLKVIPLIVALDQAIDFEKLGEQLASNPAVKDAELLREVLKELGKAAESGAKLLPR